MGRENSPAMDGNLTLATGSKSRDATSPAKVWRPFSKRENAVQRLLSSGNTNSL